MILQPRRLADALAANSLSERDKFHYLVLWAGAGTVLGTGFGSWNAWTWSRVAYLAALGIITVIGLVLGVGQGFKRSGVLAQGNRRQIFLTIGILDVGLTIVSIAVTASVTDSRTGHQPFWLSAVSWVFAFVYLPYHGVLSSALYANARLRNEGYDLEERLLSAV